MYDTKLAHAPGALELLEKLLCMDPKRRISASDALQVSVPGVYSRDVCFPKSKIADLIINKTDKFYRAKKAWV